MPIRRCGRVERELTGGCNFTRPVGDRGGLRRAVPPHDRRRRNGEVLQERFGCHLRAAMRLARAYTGANSSRVCADHPFFSVDDWFIGTTAMHAGIPRRHGS